MSTRSVIAKRQGNGLTQFEGVYHHPGDYAMMEEVIASRYQKLKMKGVPFLISSIIMFELR